ncbi:MAG: hypothetical protein M3R61_20815 [Chloroflexota bacterium]|nr:hypothetical protein [Chloroflexota bacterium]
MICYALQVGTYLELLTKLIAGDAQAHPQEGNVGAVNAGWHRVDGAR